MTNMENLETQLSEKERQQAVYEQALKSLKKSQSLRAASGYAVMSAALSYGEGSMGNGAFGKISHYAKLLCILFAFLIPSVLIWHVVL